MHRHALLVALMLLLAAPSQQRLPHLEASLDATWITHPDAAPHAFGVFHFRRTFELEDVPDAFIVHVSADNRYRLFVNGQSVAAGPQRSAIQA